MNLTENRTVEKIKNIIKKKELFQNVYQRITRNLNEQIFKGESYISEIKKTIQLCRDKI